MATQEFYIRNETDTDARGPFTHDQLQSLAEAGQVTAETLYYDATAEQWVAVGSDQALLDRLFPKKEKLKMRAKETFKSLNVQPENVKPIEVNDMLAAAEGRTADTKDKKDPGEALARAAKVGLHVATAILLISAVGLLLPFADRFAAGDFGALLAQPLAILGVIDAVLFVLLALGTVSFYPFIRFRAALGLGFLGFVFWTQGEIMPLAAAAAGAVGLYFCTVFTQFTLLAAASVLGLAGSLGLTYYFVT